MGSANPLPPNFGANLAQQIRETVQASLGGAGLRGPGHGQPRPPPSAPSSQPQSGTGTREGGHHFEQCTGDITLTTQVLDRKPLTPEEEARARRGASRLARYETPETVDMTDQQLKRLVLLEKLRNLRAERFRGDNAPPQQERANVAGGGIVPGVIDADMVGQDEDGLVTDND